MNAYSQSLIRGAVGGGCLAGLAFFTALPSQGLTWATSAAGVAFFGYMATRFAEGTYDARKPRDSE